MTAHALERLEERYARSLSDEELKVLRKMVLRGETEFVRRAHPDRAIRRAVMNGVVYVFVWSYRAADFVTFLPNEGS